MNTIKNQGVRVNLRFRIGDGPIPTSASSSLLLYTCSPTARLTQLIGSSGY